MARDVEFSLRNLKYLDFGQIEAQFNLEVERCIKDCIARPTNGKVRGVRVDFLFEPSNTEDEDCNHVRCQVKVKASVPQQKSRIIEMLTRRDGRLSFHPDLPDEPDGSTLYDEQAKREDEEREAKGE